jgi:saccharopine dehydrogenase-like NADP-dependent oxidoreductase
MTDTSNSAKARVLVIGGAGEMGSYACRVLAKADEVDGVLIADRHLQGAESLANDLGPKATAVQLDISDADALAGALAGVDIVLNTAGPFYRFGREVLNAAIASRTHYLDICDDWEPTLELLELHERAAGAGVTAVIGMGASPGISNLLALKAAEGLDRIDRLITGWSFGGGVRLWGDEGPSAAVVHWVHQCSGTIRLVCGGQVVDEAPLQELEIDYPGIGHGRGWTVGHPEALTLPRVRPEVRDCYNAM